MTSVPCMFVSVIRRTLSVFLISGFLCVIHGATRVASRIACRSVRLGCWERCVVLRDFALIPRLLRCNSNFTRASRDENAIGESVFEDFVHPLNVFWWFINFIDFGELGCADEDVENGASGKIKRLSLIGI